MGNGSYLNRASSKWLREDGPESDIVISSRIRLARNIADLPFTTMGSESVQEQVVNAVQQAIQSPALAQMGPFDMLYMGAMNDVSKQVLVEKHLVSPGLVDTDSAAVVIRPDEEVSVMVNEEDHLRIQVMLPGNQLDQAYELANEVDDAFENVIDYAFDEEKGYLTACPTNLGTGLRASLMMHLPALVLTGQINRILSAVTQVGLTVRGIYGEGSDALGNLFQISNQVTLGHSEQEIIGNLQGVATQIIEHERAARQHLLHENKGNIEDRISRSFGILAYARQMGSKEAMQRLSDVRLGIDLGIIKGVSAGILKELMVATQPGFLQQQYGIEMSPAMRDVKRASLIRERLRMEGMNHD